MQDLQTQVCVTLSWQVPGYTVGLVYNKMQDCKFHRVVSQQMATKDSQAKSVAALQAGCRRGNKLQTYGTTELFLDATQDFKVHTLRRTPVATLVDLHYYALLCSARLNI